jgi:hypothetical protein
MNELNDVERGKWKCEGEKQARMMTYLNLSLSTVLRGWEMEGSCGPFGEEKSGGRWKAVCV